MAYRQLCAVTFAVLGFVAVGCGGDTNTRPSSSEAEQQPPSNSDQPPSNSDQASNSDPVPSNTDQPPNNATDPAGSGGSGRLGTLCQQLCTSLDQLDSRCDRMPMMGDTNALCSSECQVPANILPCEDEIADVFSCLLDNLQLYCPMTDREDPPGKQNPATMACEDIIKTYNKCAAAHGITHDEDSKAPKCSVAGGCDCPSDCMACTCAAGNNRADLAACDAVCP